MVALKPLLGTQAKTTCVLGSLCGKTGISIRYENPVETHVIYEHVRKKVAKKLDTDLFKTGSAASTKK